MFKQIVAMVAAAGVGAVMENVITAVIPEDSSNMNRILLRVGSVAICWMVGCAVNDFAEHCYDSTERIIERMRKGEQEIATEGTVE